MKKLIYISAAAGIMVLGGITLTEAGDGASKADELEREIEIQPVSEAEGQSFISFRDAEQIAKTEANGEFFDITLSEDDDEPYYEVELEGAKAGQQFKIDAFDGAIRQVESNPVNPDSGKSVSAKVNPKANQQLIGKQQAVQAAHSVASGTVDDVELENEDGGFIYEVEFEDGETEYEVTVDAVDGTVLSVEADDDGDQDELDDDGRDDYDDEDE